MQKHNFTKTFYSKKIIKNPFLANYPNISHKNLVAFKKLSCKNTIKCLKQTRLKKVSRMYNN